MAVSFISGGNRREQLIFRKSLTNFITLRCIEHISGSHTFNGDMLLTASQPRGPLFTIVLHVLIQVNVFFSSIILSVITVIYLEVKKASVSGENYRTSASRPGFNFLAYGTSRVFPCLIGV